MINIILGFTFLLLISADSFAGIKVSNTDQGTVDSFDSVRVWVKSRNQVLRLCKKDVINHESLKIGQVVNFKPPPSASKASGVFCE